MDPVTDWTYLGLAALCVLAAYVASLAWVRRDAERRGADPRLAVLFVALAVWPLSVVIWHFARSGRFLAPKGGGSAWG